MLGRISLQVECGSLPFHFGLRHVILFVRWCTPKRQCGILSLGLKCCMIPPALLSFVTAKRKAWSVIPGGAEAHGAGSELLICRPSQSSAKRSNCCLKVWSFGELCHTVFCDSLTSSSVGKFPFSERRSDWVIWSPPRTQVLSHCFIPKNCPVRWLPQAGTPASDPDNCPIITGLCDTQPGNLTARNGFWPLWLGGICRWQMRVSRTLSGSKEWPRNQEKLHTKFSLHVAESVPGCKPPRGSRNVTFLTTQL